MLLIHHEQMEAELLKKSLNMLQQLARRVEQVVVAFAWRLGH